jgi:tetraprenyl-beta-curcumene synthase
VERGGSSRRTPGRSHALPSLGAMVVANARYWPSVAPVVRGELARWRGPAERIADAQLRALAIGKLAEERFNAEVAATLATLAPQRTRKTAVRAIVALELLFDYLDGRTELPSRDPLGEGTRLFGSFTAAVDPQPRAHTHEHAPDDAYMRALGQTTSESLFALPAAAAVARSAKDAAERCAQAQTRLHAAATLGDAQLRDWAIAAARESGLGWREYVGGSASSVLAVHALIAAAADSATSAEDARRIDAAYLAFGGVITMLDSVVDHSADHARGEAGFSRLFANDDELERAMCALTREALARAREAPHGDHHAMTLAGVVAYYTTHPGAREPHARTLVSMLRRELSPTIWPGLAVLLGWRAAKRSRASAVGAFGKATN